MASSLSNIKDAKPCDFETEENALDIVSKRHMSWSLYPVALLALLVILLLYLFLFAPVTVTLDGYSNLWSRGAEISD